jgi:DNA-binding transcriptional MerR regulator
VDNDELMTIGRFARLTGLPIGTLRHYDEVGLLLPACVDPASGYRRYRREQAQRARQIAMLRWDGLPIAPGRLPAVPAQDRRR